MALSNKQQEQINVLVKKGNLSNRAIAKDVGCSESAVRTYIKKNDVKKNAITELAEREITNTIIADEINAEKTQLNNAEKKAYNEVLVDMRIARNIFDNSTMDNQALVNKAQTKIKQIVEVNEDAILDNLPNLMAIGKMTETNRKQLLGTTETHKPKEETKSESLKVTFE